MLCILICLLVHVIAISKEIPQILGYTYVCIRPHPYTWYRVFPKHFSLMMIMLCILICFSRYLYQNLRNLTILTPSQKKSTNTMYAPTLYMHSSASNPSFILFGEKGQSYQIVKIDSKIE